MGPSESQGMLVSFLVIVLHSLVASSDFKGVLVSACQLDGHSEFFR